MNKKQLIGLIQKVDFWGLRRIAQENNLEWLVVYGSRVFGRPQENSDLDVGYDGPVDDLQIDPDVISHLELDIHCAKLVNPGVRQGMSKGLLVYERQDGVFEMFKKRTKREFGDYVAQLKRELEDDLNEGYIVVHSSRSKESGKTD